MSARLTRNAKTKSSLALFIRFAVVILRPVLTLHIENAEHAIVWVTIVKPKATVVIQPTVVVRIDVLTVVVLAVLQIRTVLPLDTFVVRRVFL